ncbi:MAG TPA: hypothetical protein VGB17_00390, partial [Pyrinomonadaceae bacterium]
MSTTQRNIAEPDSSRRMIFIIVAIVSVLVVGAILFIARSGYFGGAGAERPRLEGGLRAGTAEFEQYKEKIFMDTPEATEAKRALGDMVMTLRTTVRNF